MALKLYCGLPGFIPRRMLRRKEEDQRARRNIMSAITTSLSANL